MEAMRIAMLTVALGLLLAVTAAPALAACPQGTVEPGNSEVDQYQETIPGSCGDQNTSGGSGGGGGGGSLPADTVDELNSLGDDGAATAGIAAATAPGVAGGSGSDGKSVTGSTKGGASGVESVSSPSGSSASDDGSPLSAVTQAVGGDSSDGGVGVILPLILLGTLIAALVALAVRRRSSV